MKLAILGAGNIARTMAKTIKKMDEVEAYAVAARSLPRAKEFANEFGFTKAYGSYVEMLENEEVDVVYIATPHSHHYEQMKLCLEHGKHVLCEKAFTVNAEQAREIFHMAEEKKLLVTEAIWTRYMPSRKMLNDIIASGMIGTVTSLTANLGYSLGTVERMIKPELAGGALLDLGVYTLNFASMVFGTEIKEMDCSAVMTETGVDAMESITLTFEDGKMAVLYSSMLSALDRTGYIYGDKGYIQVTNINNIEKIRVFDQNHWEVAGYDVPKQITGYEYEVEACMEAWKNGALECPQMPHKETIRIMELMDQVRSKINYEPCTVQK